MVFEPLVVNTAQGVQPWLAQCWDISPDGKQYTFHLRQDVTFSDGEKFNAQAVKQNFDAILANYSRHAWLELVQQIEKTEVVDDYTFALHLKNPYYPTLVELGLTRPFRFISPRNFINGQTKDGVSAYTGTGPWLLVKQVKNQYARFNANPHYWGTPPKLKSVMWKVIPDRQSMLMALEKGNVQLIFGTDGDMLDSDSFVALQAEGKFHTAISEPVASRALVLNSSRAITADRQVRLALQYAVDKQAIAEGIMSGSESVADTLLAISWIAFVLIQLSPSDPAEVALRVNMIVPTDDAIAAMRHELGLDQPFWRQYVSWLQRVLHLDFGTSFVTRTSVWQELLLAAIAGFVVANTVTTFSSSYVLTMVERFLAGVSAGLLWALLALLAATLVVVWAARQHGFPAITLSAGP